MGRKFIRGLVILAIALTGVMVTSALTADALPVHSFSAGNRVLVVAHRGGRGLWPENTMLAFREATAMGADVLETDVHSSADGVLVLMHDDTVDRTTDGSGPVHDHTLAELLELDAGYRWTDDDGASYPFRGQDILVPTLSEFLDSFPDMLMSVEIKQKEPSIIDDVCQMVRERGLQGQMLVGSFDTEVVNEFRRACPGIATTATRPEITAFLALSKLYLEAAHHSKAEVLFVPEKEGWLTIVNDRLVSAAGNKGAAVHIWTINEKDDMRRFVDIGVDGIATDYPDRLLEILGEG